METQTETRTTLRGHVPFATIMAILKLHKAATSANDMRPSLEAIRILPDGNAYASNGHILAKAKHNLPLDITLKSGDILIAAYKALFKARKRFAASSELEWYINDDGDFLLEMPNMVGEIWHGWARIPAMDGHRFPYVANIVAPMTEPIKGHRFAINVELLSQLVEAITAQAGREELVILEMNPGEDGHLAPLMVRPFRDSSEAIGILMPLKIKVEE